MGTNAERLRPSRRTTRHGFEIAIICALTLEADAVEALFDVYWDDMDSDESPFDKAPGDPNTYSTGVIGRHNVVLVHMPGMGKAHAAAVAANCRISFPNIRLALVVGICGVAPFSRTGEEIVLGDVIISEGIIQYDLGRGSADLSEAQDGLSSPLNRPNAEIRGFLAKMRGLRARETLCGNMTSYLSILRQESGLKAEYPGKEEDKLFEAEYRHDGNKSCEKLGCNGKLVSRRRLQTTQDNPEPVIHFGLIASGDTVMKSGEDRDRIVEEHDIIAFEMEGAGIWDSFPCLVIKGACDYADSHKNKKWQRYAAATAATCMKGFLSYWVPFLRTDAGGDGRSPEIESRGMQAMEIQKQVFVEENPNTLIGMSNHASKYYTQGRWMDSKFLSIQR